MSELFYLQNKYTRIGAKKKKTRIGVVIVIQMLSALNAKARAIKSLLNSIYFTI